MSFTFGQTETFKQALRPFAGLPSMRAGELQRQRDVVHSAQRGKQVEELEDHSNSLEAERGRRAPIAAHAEPMSAQIER